MSRFLYGNLDLGGNQILNVLLQVLASDPTGVEGKIYYNSTSDEIKYHNGTTWVSLGQAGSGGPPSGNAGGDLSGTYPNPQIAAGVIIDADVSGSAAIQQSKIANLTTDLAAKAPAARSVISGAGLTGGGDLSADRTLAVGAGTGITVNADDIAINRAVVDPWYVDTAGDTMTGYLTLSNNPSSDMHAATKQYVDLAAQGLDHKNSVKAASTANIASLSGAQTIDGIACAAGDRVLVKDQSTATANGIYVVAAGAWTRATDADGNGEISDGTLVPVEQGTTQADSLWLCTATGATPWVPGTSTSTWTKFSSVNDLQAGAGLTKSGTQLDVGAGNGIQVNADSIQVKNADATLSVAAGGVGVVSAPKWTAPMTLTLGTDLTGSVNFDGSAGVTLNATLAAGAGGKRYSAALTASTSQTVTHNLNTRDVQVSVYNGNSPWEEVWVEVEHTSVNSLTVKANPALPAGYRVVVTA